MRVALCDDNGGDLARLAELTEEFIGDFPHIPVEYTAYASSRTLCKDLDDGIVYDVYVLDMLMPERNGIDVGNAVRAAGYNSVIIYTTTTKDYALDAYSVFAGRYLLKPVSRADFEEAMSYAVENCPRKREPEYELRLPTGVVPVPYSSIEYAECLRRCTVLHLTDGRVLTGVTIRTSFQNEVSCLLQDDGFAQPHHSFAVNLASVDLLSPDTLTLKSGEEIPVSRSRQKEFKHRYLAYVASRYR